MKEFLVITAFRDTGDPYRRRNIAACIDSVSRNFPEADHVIAEQADRIGSCEWFESQHFKDVIHIPVDPAVCAGVTDGLFHKPLLLNGAVDSFPGRKLYVMVDADVYLDRNLAEYAMKEGGPGRLVYPYGDTIYMDELDTRCKVAGKPLWGGEKDHGVTIRRQTGLTMAFTGDDFGAVRGFDAEFAGWGAEDDAFMYKFLRTGRQVVRNPDRSAVAYHMFHPKVNTPEYTGGETYRKNRVYCACIRRMQDGDFARYLDGASTLDGLVAKYRALGRLETSLDWRVSGTRTLHMDTTIYDIDRGGEMSIDRIMDAVGREDGPEGIIWFVDTILNSIGDLPGEIRADIDRRYAEAREACGIS